MPDGKIFIQKAIAGNCHTDVHTGVAMTIDLLLFLWPLISALGFPFR